MLLVIWSFAIFLIALCVKVHFWGGVIAVLALTVWTSGIACKWARKAP